MSAYKTRKYEEAREARQMKTFYVSGTYQKTTAYFDKKRKKSYTSVDPMPLTKTVRARNEEEAKKKAGKQLEEEYDPIETGEGGRGGKEDSPDIEETNIDYDAAKFIATTPASSEATVDMRMRSATYANYDFIPQDTTHLKDDGFCVVDVLLGVYGDLPRNKKLTREWIEEQCGYSSKAVGMPLTDEDLERFQLENPAYEKDSANWEVVTDDDGEDGVVQLKRPTYTSQLSQGITPKMVHKMCVELDISHYAFDITNTCFLKHTCKNK